MVVSWPFGIERNMERDKGKPEHSSAHGANNHVKTPLVVTTPSQRLSAQTQVRAEDKVKTYETSSPKNVLGSSRPTANTKLPRPTGRNQIMSQVQEPPRRSNLTLKDLYQMTEEEVSSSQAAQASPSPAPRPWRGTRGGLGKGAGDGRFSSALSQNSTGSVMSPSRPAQKLPVFGNSDAVKSIDSLETMSQVSEPVGETSDVEFERRLREHANETGLNVIRKRKSGPCTRTRLSPGIVEAGRELVRTSSIGSLQSDSSPRGVNGLTPQTKTKGKSWRSRRFRGKSEASSDDTVPKEPANEPPVPGSLVEQPWTVSPNRPLRTPEKSFVWEIEAEFTGGGLQVSKSPAVRLGQRRTNTSLDEIKARETELQSQFGKSLKSRPRKTRLDEIFALEKEAALKFPDEPPEPETRGSDECEEDAKAVTLAHSDMRNSPRYLRSSRVDELRAREIEVPTGRVFATARSDQIRLRDKARKAGASTPEPDKQAIHESTVPLRKAVAEGDADPDAATTVLGSSEAGKEDGEDGGVNDRDGEQVREGRGEAAPSRGIVHARHVSSQLPHRPAHAPRDSPKTDQKLANEDDNAKGPGRSSKEDVRLGKADGAKCDSRPTVGFTGLERESSAGSRTSKRSSRELSENDPTERINAEVKLFAPEGDQSERGSLHASSPPPEEEDAGDETPRATKKIEALTTPTPKIIGAYVNSPATVRTEQADDEKRQSEAAEHVSDKENSPTSKRVPAAVLRGRRLDLSPRKTKHTLSAKGRRDTSRPLSVSAYRRARSAPGICSPLVNSANPPTVKDDLREIRQTQQIDDSTLDDFAELLNTPENGSPESTTDLPEIKTEPHHDEGIFDREKEYAAYDRLGRRVKTALIETRTVKAGIERLELEVSHTDIKKLTDIASVDAEGTCPICLGHAAAIKPSPRIVYIHLPVPRLWYCQPTFRLSFAGLVVLILTIWYMAESCTCSLYCKPTYCRPDRPCNWSPDDPLWGFALPVKADQWTTDGRGRALVHRIGPAISDWVADMWDGATGRNITQVDPSHFAKWEHREQHRRRLAKRGMTHPFLDKAEDRPKFAAWRAARMAKERFDSDWEMGFAVHDDDSMAADERV